MVSAVLAGCTDRPPGVIPVPQETVPLTIPGGTPTTLTDYGTVPLPPVPGRTTTTSVSLTPGQARLEGTVTGPDGPAGGAVVRVERLVGRTSAAADVTAGADGTWRADLVKGGSYRVRAWRPPDLAQTSPAVFFLGDGETKTVPLVLARFDGTRVSAVAAPDPLPVVGPVNLTVLVARAVVDQRGLVVAVPQPGVEVGLSASGGFTVSSPARQVTDASGGARWRLSCTAPGGSLFASLGGTEARPLAVPGCGEGTGRRRG